MKIMHQALQDNPLSYTTLHAQCDFLLSKGKPEWARQIAQQAVNAAPSEFVTWAKLTETYIELDQLDAALLTLNSCPMFTFNERDLHRMPTPVRTHLPVKKFIADSNILDEESSRDNEADVALLRLPAPGLRGTFAKAYALLAQMVSKIGWDELLKTRSTVFVMEEEYRKHKNAESIDQGQGQGQGQGPNRGLTPEAGAAGDDDASSSGTRSPDNRSRSPSNIPTIRISSESDRVAAATNGHVDELETVQEGPELDQQPQSAGTDAPQSPEATQPQGPEAMSAFSNKRLCERWLDNLFL